MNRILAILVVMSVGATLTHGVFEDDELCECDAEIGSEEEISPPPPAVPIPNEIQQPKVLAGKERPEKTPIPVIVNESVAAFG